VLAAVSNKNIFHMLGMYIEGVRKANVTNAMVVALDEETGAFCKSKGFPYWVRAPPRVQLQNTSIDVFLGW
jgi:hypothetical protein